MIFLRPAARHDVDLHWLRSEWRKLPSALRSALPTDAQALIDEPDLEDPGQNEARSRILRAYRGPVLNRVPDDARYTYVQLEADDRPSLYVIAVWDWFLDTGRTFELLNTLTHLQQGRGGVINGVRESVDHLQRVQQSIKFIDEHPHAHSNEHLILIATKESGPYTIIDGTHRAAALLRRQRASPTAPWNAILIESKRMTGQPLAHRIPSPSSGSRRLRRAGRTGLHLVAATFSCRLPGHQYRAITSCFQQRATAARLDGSVAASLPAGESVSRPLHSGPIAPTL